MKKLNTKYIPFLIVIFVGISLQWKYLNEFPSHIHAWAQADRYALALGFTKNGLDFFHPQTFVLNHQFPGNFEVANQTSVTSVDFPIHDYLVAVIMNMTGSSAPVCFRMYVFIYSLIGLFFLYLLVAGITKKNWFALAVTLFAATSPVFVYYQSGFLPTIPSLSNIFIASYFYIKYLSNKKLREFGFTIFFITLASLSRTPFSIFLISLMLTEIFIRSENNKVQTKIFKLVACTISFACIAGYFLYNQYLLQTYGSIFLGHPMPPKNFAESIALIKGALINWFFHYFSIYHYLTIIVLGVWGFILYKENSIAVSIKNKAVILLLLSILGYICYTIPMLKQFPAHDYYFLDTFFVPIIFTIVLLINYLKHKIALLGKISFVVIIGLSAATILNAANYQKKRRITGYWDRTTTTISNFQDSETLLNSLSVPKASKILVIGAYAPNIPFILMDRMGYDVMTTSEANFKNALQWDFNYIVIQNCYLVSDVVNHYPEIINHISKVADNGKISVYKVLSKPQNKTLMHFLGLDIKKPFLSDQITFDTIAPSNWQMPEIKNTYSFSGKYSGFTNKNEEYGITYKTKSLPNSEKKSFIVMVQGKFFTMEPLNDCFIVVSVNESGKNIYYNAFNLKDNKLKTESWQNVQFLYQLPAPGSSNYEFAVYLWNNGKNNIWYDDFGLNLYWLFI